MKQIITIILLAISLNSLAQKNINIQVVQDLKKNAQPAAGYDFENYLLQNLITYKIDTIKMIRGKMSIPNKTKTITPYALLRLKPRQSMIFFVEPKSKFQLVLSEPQLSIKSVKGSKAQSDYFQFMKEQQELQRNYQLVQAAYPKATNKDSVGKQVKLMQFKMQETFMNFLNSQKDNNMGAYMVYDVSEKNKNINPAQLKGLFDKLSDKGKNTHFGKAIGTKITRLTAMNIGSTAPDFTLKDEKGKEYTLSSLRGKYVLVDFWASWCGPCVKEIPHLKTAYQKYKDKGFEIMSVSIDRDRNRWVSALNRYQMPWISVIDNAKNEEKVTQKLYYVPTIPRTILLDPKGVVIGKDFRGPALEHKLAEIFTK